MFAALFEVTGCCLSDSYQNFSFFSNSNHAGKESARDKILPDTNCSIYSNNKWTSKYDQVQNIIPIASTNKHTLFRDIAYNHHRIYEI